MTRSIMPCILNYPLSVVNKAGEDDDAKDEEKHEEHQLLC